MCSILFLFCWCWCFAVLLLLLMEGLGGRGWGEDIFNILYFSLPLYLKLVILHCDPLWPSGVFSNTKKQVNADFYLKQWQCVNYWYLSFISEWETANKIIQQDSKAYISMHPLSKILVNCTVIFFNLINFMEANKYF